MLRDLRRKQTPMVGAVLFDLYGTLITESVIQPTRASSLAGTLGLEDRSYRVEWKKRRPDVVRGRTSFAAALTEISESLVGRSDVAAIRAICEQRIQEKAVVYARIFDDVAACVAALARQGVRMGIVSNGFEEDVLGWPQCALAPKFECAVFSCKEGVAKPDPEIYMRALHRLGVKPAHAVYIGDGGDNELVGAEQAGLRAGRAAWFVREMPRKDEWPELRNSQDVTKFVTGA
jgi:putative hydrolase of the HAD superfamily